MPADPTILFVGHGAERSGPPIFLRHFQRWLRAGPDPTFATVLIRGGDLLDDFRQLGSVRLLDDRWTTARVAQAGLGRLLGAPAYGRMRDARYRARMARAAPADLVYLNSASADSIHVVRQLPRGHHRLITHVHELQVGLGYGLDDDERRFLFGATDHFLAVSQAVIDELTGRYGVPADRISLSPGFIDATERPPADRARRVRAELGIPASAPVVGACGMTDWRKAPDLFIRLAWESRQLPASQGVHFVWVGGDRSGPNWWPLEHDLRHLGLEERVHFVGIQERPIDYFAACDLFVLPAREDAYPLACLEAAALGVPTVCFDNGGMVEFVRACDGGVVVGYPDVASMARAVRDLLADDEARRAMGARAAAAARDRHHVAEGASALWQELCRLGGT